MNENHLRINFVLPPAHRISGGPLAILEYANRFIERGHEVSITTYPDGAWDGSEPFPWFQFKGPIYYKRTRHLSGQAPATSLASLHLTNPSDRTALGNLLASHFGFNTLRESIIQTANVADREFWDYQLNSVFKALPLIETMPDCDLNIATLWETVLPVMLSHKGKPVYFMQHYEEIFYQLQPELLMQRLLARLSYSLPVYKVANSSWLQSVIRTKYGQDVPFSNNGLELSDFSPRLKASLSDGVIRVFTYSRPEDWKGFGDAVAAMSKVRARYGARVEWRVFGYRFPELPEDNPYARYTYHPKLSFAELAELYATSDVALCPSWFESFPLPPLEAMASGTAVITTDYGTEDYAFDGRNALVVGTRDVEGMYNALRRLIDDEDLRERLAQAGLETSKEFTWDRAVEKREQILLDIHHGRTTYDLYAPARLGLTDRFGIEFERTPVDVEISESGLVCSEGSLYLLHGGVKRRITDPALIPKLMDCNMRYITVDNLTFVRTPPGFPITNLAEVPRELIRLSEKEIPMQQHPGATQGLP